MWWGLTAAYTWGFMNHSKLQLQVFFHFVSTTSCVGLNHAKKNNLSQPENSYHNKKVTDWLQAMKERLSQNQWQKERRATESKPTFDEVKA